MIEVQLQRLPLSDDLVAIRRKASSLHVALLVIPYTEDETEQWYLAEICRQRDSVPGAGATVLRELHTLADQHGATIRLRAGSRFTKKRHVKLIRYYEQFGYVVIRGNEMKREPKTI
jgi:hypothetical protein